MQIQQLMMKKTVQKSLKMMKKPGDILCARIWEAYPPRDWSGSSSAANLLRDLCGSRAATVQKPRRLRLRPPGVAPTTPIPPHGRHRPVQTLRRARANLVTPRGRPRAAGPRVGLAATRAARKPALIQSGGRARDPERILPLICPGAQARDPGRILSPPQGLARDLLRRLRPLRHLQ